MLSQIQIPEIFYEFTKPARYKVAYGGRGSSKSWSFIILLLLESMQSKHLILFAREIQKSIKDSSYTVLVEMISRFNLVDQFTIKQDEVIHKLTGSKFIFAGLYRNISQIKSKEGITRVFIEEAHSISQESLDVLIPTIRTEGSEIWIVFNPDKEEDSVYKTFITEGRPDSIIKKVNFTDNPFFPNTLKAEMEFDRARDPEKYAWVWEGNCRQHSEAQIFRGFYTIESFETPGSAEFLHGADWGFSEDPTTLVRGFVRDNVLYIDKEVYGLHTSIDNLPELFSQISTAKTWPIVADSARPETIDYLKKRGFKIVGAKKGAGSIEDGIERLKAFANIVIHPDCKHTIDEFRLYSYKVNKQNGLITPTPEDKNNHIIDSLRYMTETSRRGRNKLSIRI